MAAFAVLRAETPLWNWNENQHRVRSNRHRIRTLSVDSEHCATKLYKTYQDIHFSERAIFGLGLDEENAQVSNGDMYVCISLVWTWVCISIYLTRRK